MNITINVVAASVELAERDVTEHYSKLDISPVALNKEKDEVYYIPEAQEMFNDAYDDYFETLTNNQIDDKN